MGALEQAESEAAREKSEHGNICGDAGKGDGGENVNKVKFWRYSLPPQDGLSGWGIFLLDSTGMFAAVTDYGNYAYKWTHHGEDDFRNFVIDVAHSPEYVVENLCQGRSKEYCGKKTFEVIKEYILEYQRNGTLTKETAKKEWALLHDEDYEELYYRENFHDWYQKTSIDCASEFSVYDYSNQAYSMAEKLLPRLAEVIKSELAAEETTQTKEA